MPDEFVRSGEVVLVDLPADALRRRIAAGQVYSADRVGGAISDYFRVSNLEALSDLAQAWVADELKETGAELLARRGINLPGWRRVIVAGSPRSWRRWPNHRVPPRSSWRATDPASAS